MVVSQMLQGPGAVLAVELGDEPIGVAWGWSVYCGFISMCVGIMPHVWYRLRSDQCMGLSILGVQSIWASS